MGHLLEVLNHPWLWEIIASPTIWESLLGFPRIMDLDMSFFLGPGSCHM